MSVCISLLLLVLSVAQGGFFAQTYLFAGFLACIMIAVRPKASVNLIILIASCVACILLVISSILNKLGFGGFVEAMRATSVILIMLVVSGLNNAERDKAANISIWGMGALALISISAYAGIFEITGMVSNHRLEGFMQYANATGILYAIAYFCVYKAEDKRVLLQPIFIVAMLLTLSFGTFLAFAIGIICNSFMFAKDKPLSLLFEVSRIVFAAMPATLLLLAQVRTSAWLSIVGMVLLAVLCVTWQKACRTLLPKKSIALACFIIGIAGACSMLCFRGNEAAATFVERITMSWDGIRAIVNNPIWGIGPGAWGTAKTAWQSYGYDATIIHNSYVQFGVDGGIIVMASLIFAVAHTIRCSPKTNKAALLMLALHSLIDLSLYFTAIPAFSALQFFDNASATTKTEVGGVPLRFAAIVMSVLYLWLFLKINALI